MATWSLSHSVCRSNVVRERKVEESVEESEGEGEEVEEKPVTVDEKQISR